MKLNIIIIIVIIIIIIIIINFLCFSSSQHWTQNAQIYND